MCGKPVPCEGVMFPALYMIYMDCTLKTTDAVKQIESWGMTRNMSKTPMS